MNNRLSSPFLKAWLLVWALWLCVHILPAPGFGFVMDDWSNIYSARAYPSFGVMVSDTVCHPQRPVSSLLTTTTFYLLGDSPGIFALLSAVAWGVSLALVMKLGQHCAGHLNAGILAGVLLSAVPTISEVVNWPTMIVSAAVLSIPGYLFATLAFYQGICRDQVHWWWIIGGTIAFGWALLAYEIGVFLPLAWMWWFPFSSWKNRFLPLIVSVSGDGLWILWRITKGFGLGSDWALASHFSVDSNTESLISNVLYQSGQVVHWWVGRNMVGSLVSGWKTAVGAGMPLLWLGVALILVSVIFWRTGGSVGESPNKRRGVAIGFSVTWIVVSIVPSLFSYTASRLNVLPAIGVVWFLSAVMPDVFRRGGVTRVLLVVLIPCWLCNIGTTLQWARAGEFCSRAFNVVKAERPAWEAKGYVLFDSSALVETHPELAPMRAVSTLGNAGLFRGFVGMAWLHLAAPEIKNVHPVFDLEFGARIDGDAMVWHQRYQSELPSTPVPMEQVHVIDLLKAGTTPSQQQK